MNYLDFKLETVSVTRLFIALLLAFLLSFFLLSSDQETKSSDETWKKVKVYFGNSELDTGEVDCTEVFPVTRWVESSAYPPMAALRDLLKGPTEEEKEEGYFTSINSGVAIKGFWVGDEITKVRFSSRIEESLGGTCRVANIHSQIITTLKQFDNIDKVRVYVNDRFKRALQP